MPSVTCPGCGSSLKVPDGLAGKKAKCRKCETFFQIPAVSAVTAGPPPVPAGPPPVPAGHAAGHGGQQVSSRPMPPRRPAPVYEEDDEDFEERPRRRGKKKKKQQSSPVLMVSLISGGAVLAIGVAVGAIYLASTSGSNKETKPNASDPPVVAAGNFTPPGGNLGVPAGANVGGGSLADKLKYMPADADFVVSVNIAEILNSPSFGEVKNVFPELQPLLQQNLDPTGEFQVKATDFGAVMVGGIPDSNLQGGKGLVLVQMNNTQLLDQVVAKVAPVFAPTTIGTHTVYQSPDGKGALVRLEKDKLLAGDPQSLRAVLERQGPAKFSPVLQQGLDNVDPASTIFIVGNSQKLSQNNPALGGVGTQPQSALIEVKVAQDIGLKVVAVFANPADAQQSVQQLEKSLQDAKQNAALLPAEIGNLLNSVQTKNDGAKVTVTARVKAGPIAQMAKSAAKDFNPAMFGIPGGANPFGPKKVGGPVAVPQPGDPFAPKGAAPVVPNPADPFAPLGVPKVGLPVNPGKPVAIPTKPGAFPGGINNPGANANPGFNPNPGAIPNAGFNPDPAAIPNAGFNPNAGAIPNAGFNPNIGAIPNAGFNPNVGGFPNAGFNPNVGGFPNAGFNPNPGIFDPNNPNNFPVVPQVPNVGIPNNPNIPALPNNNNFPNINGGKNLPKAPVIGGTIPPNAVIGGQKPGNIGIPTIPNKGGAGIGGFGNVPTIPNTGIGNPGIGAGGFGGKTGFPVKGPFGK